MIIRDFVRGGRRRFVLLTILLLTPAGTRAGEPVVRNLNLRGLQLGGTTTLILDGDQFGKTPRLLLPFPAQQQLQKGSTDKRALIDVTLAGSVTPGYYHLRVVSEKGVSSPLVIGVDRLPQRPLTASIEQLPVALHGTVSGAATVETRFTGKAGQKVLVDVEAQRLGSKLRPVVHLYNAKRLQLAWAWTTPTLFGDARLEATLPADGDYTVTVHDAEYAAPAPGFFRLRIGQWAYVDQVFPPVVAKGKAQTVEFLGPASPTRLDLPATTTAGALPLGWPGEGLWSGPRPFVTVSARNEIVEQPASAAKSQELPPGPVGVCGRLLTPYEEDRYRVPVTPGTKVRFEVLAERLGSPLDVALVVRNERGEQLARAEDSPGTLDPTLDFTVPAKVNAVIVGVIDAQGRGGPRGIYRLQVDPQGTAVASDFRLLSPALSVALPVGGRAVVPVRIDRRGYQGSLTVFAAGLPMGARLEGTTIPQDSDGTLLTVAREKASGDAVLAHFRGRAADGAERPVVIEGSPVERIQPWLAAEIALALTPARAADFQIDWRDLPTDAGPVPGKRMALPIKLRRPVSKSVVRLKLLTSQLRPLVNGKTDPNQSLRFDKTTELAPNATTGELTVLVPPQLPASVYDVTVEAELLSPDKRSVLAVAYAPVRRMTVRMPLVVRLDGPARIETTVDPKKGTTLKIKGQVERREGLKGDVALTLTGLPPGARAGNITVKADTTTFTVELVLPPNLPAGEIAGLKLSGTAAADPKQPNVRVKSRDVELTLVVRTAK